MVRPPDTVLVVGCSGRQGYHTATELLRSHTVTVRGLTRDPTKEACQDLVQRGAELVQGDLNQPGTLKAAFQGVTTAFILTDYWDSRRNISEAQQGLNAVEAALAAGVRNIVFSTLPDTASISQGRYNVEHFTEKVKVEQRIRELRQQKRFDSAVFVRAGFYWQNLSSGLVVRPMRQADGSFVYYFPVDPARTSVAGLDICDFGPIVAKILVNATTYDGRSINIAYESLTFARIVELMSEVSGLRITAKEISEDEAKRGGMPTEVIDMLKWFRDFSLFGGEHISPLATSLNPNMKSFRSFLQTHSEWRQQLFQ